MLSYAGKAQEAWAARCCLAISCVVCKSFKQQLRGAHKCAGRWCALEPKLNVRQHAAATEHNSCRLTKVKLCKHWLAPHGFQFFHQVVLESRRTIRYVPFGRHPLHPKVHAKFECVRPNFMYQLIVVKRLCEQKQKPFTIQMN